MKWMTLMPLYEGEGAGGQQQQQQQTPWHQGVDPLILGHAQNRGWDKLDAPAATAAAIKAHMEAEKYIGIPADQIIRAPKDANDTEALNNIFTRIGRPKEAKEYGLTDLKDDKGTPFFEPAFADHVSNVAHRFGIPKDAAPEFAKSINKFFADKAAADVAAKTAEINMQKETLDKEWGANKEAHLFIARQAALKLGWTPEQVDAIENSVGYLTVMKSLHAVGTKIGEDRFVNNTGGNNTGLMTKEQAAAEKATLMQDIDFITKFNKGDTEAVKRMQALNVIIVGAAAR